MPRPNHDFRCGEGMRAKLPDFKLMAVLLSVLIYGSAGGPVNSQTSATDLKARKPTKEESVVTQLNQKWADWIAAGDMKALERLYADDFILTSGDGALRGKKEELDDLKPTPDIKTLFFNVEDVRTRVYGNAAVVTGHAQWRINLKGRDMDIERRYTSVFVKENGEWRMVAQQLGRIAAPPK